LDLKAYERMKIKNIIIPLFIKDRCESCGLTNNLEMHHQKQFVEMLRESLDRLNYKYNLMTEDYTEEELINITDMLLGIHIQSTYTTLCEKCHTEIHSSGDLIAHFLKEKKKKEEGALDALKLEIIFNKFVGIKLFKNEQKEFKQMLNELYNSPKGSHNCMGLKTINSYYHDNNLNYTLDSKIERSRKFGKKGNAYWLISKTNNQ